MSKYTDLEDYHALKLSEGWYCSRKGFHDVCALHWIDNFDVCAPKRRIPEIPMDRLKIAARILLTILWSPFLAIVGIFGLLLFIAGGFFYTIMYTLTLAMTPTKRWSDLSTPSYKEAMRNARDAFIPWMPWQGEAAPRKIKL